MNDVIYGGITVGTALAFLGGGLGVSIVAQLIKRVFKLNSSKVIQFLVVALSFAAAALVWIIKTAHGNPSVLGSHTVGVLGIANAAHTFIVSDADAFVSKVKVALNDEAANTETTAVESVHGPNIPLATEATPAAATTEPDF